MSFTDVPLDNMKYILSYLMFKDLLSLRTTCRFAKLSVEHMRSVRDRILWNTKIKDILPGLISAKYVLMHKRLKEIDINSNCSFGVIDKLDIYTPIIEYREGNWVMFYFLLKYMKLFDVANFFIAFTRKDSPLVYIRVTCVNGIKSLDTNGHGVRIYECLGDSIHNYKFILNSYKPDPKPNSMRYLFGESYREREPILEHCEPIDVLSRPCDLMGINANAIFYIRHNQDNTHINIYESYLEGITKDVTRKIYMNPAVIIHPEEIANRIIDGKLELVNSNGYKISFTFILRK